MMAALCDCRPEHFVYVTCTCDHAGNLFQVCLKSVSAQPNTNPSRVSSAAAGSFVYRTRLFLSLSLFPILLFLQLKLTRMYFSTCCLSPRGGLDAKFSPRIKVPATNWKPLD